MKWGRMPTQLIGTGIVGTSLRHFLIDAEKLLQPGNRPQLLGEVLVGYCPSFNWGYLDGVQVEGLTQWELGFLLFMLIKFGAEERSPAFYAQQCQTAFPVIIERLDCPYLSPLDEHANAIRIRFFDHFTCWFGLAEDTLVLKAHILDRGNYRKTALLDEACEMRR